MARQFSDEARRSAAIARKIKNRLGQQAYETYKRTGVVPAGLDNTPTASKRPDGPAASSAKPKGPGTPSKPKLEKLEPGKPSNYNGTFYKAKFAVIVNGEKVGEIRQQQHRIRQGSSYTTGWKNDFAEWKFFDAKGREVKLDQALSRAELMPVVISHLEDKFSTTAPTVESLRAQLQDAQRRAVYFQGRRDPARRREQLDRAESLRAQLRDLVGSNRDEAHAKSVAQPPSIAPPTPPAPAKSKLEEVAARFPVLSDEQFLQSMSRRSKNLPPATLNAVASVQARDDLTDARLVRHFQSTGVYARRGESPELVKKHRDDFYAGKSIPLWSIPEGVPIAVYRDDNAQVPMIIGKVVGHPRRKPEGLTAEVLYTRIEADDGSVYEYPALLGGGPKSPHVKHASFSAIDSLANGRAHVGRLGWEFPNFANDENAGEGGSPEDLATLAKNMQRAMSFARAVEERRRKKELSAQP